MAVPKGELVGQGIGSPDGAGPHANIYLRRTEFDGKAYEAPTWEQMGIYTFELARQIIDSGQSFDRVIAFAKGGWTWSRTLVDYLAIKQMSSIRAESYKDNIKLQKPRIIQPLTDAVGGERVLLFDEVIDSGDTTQLGLDYVGVMGAKDIKIATLCYKPDFSKVVPDFYAFTSNAWVFFPHEVREFVEGRADEWRPQGLTDAQILDRLVEIGAQRNQAEYFLALTRHE